MIRRIKRWWYRFTGQKAEAKYMLNLCQMLDAYTLGSLNDNGWAMRRWEHDYRHIHDLYEYPARDAPTILEILDADRGTL